MTKYTGWVYHQPYYFYFIGLLKENFLVIFSIVGFAIAIKEKSFLRKSLFIIFLLPFLFYNFAAHKEMRLMIPLLPFLYIFTSSGLAYFLNSFKKYGKFILILLFGLWAFLAIPQLRFDRYDDALDVFYEYIKSVKTDEGIWISNPSFIAYSDKKAEELIYYPLYSSKKAIELQEKVGIARIVMLNTCDILPCRREDKDCLEETDKFIRIFEKKLRLRYKSKMGNCDYFIFEK